ESPADAVEHHGAGDRRRAELSTRAPRGLARALNLLLGKALGDSDDRAFGDAACEVHRAVLVARERRANLVFAAGGETRFVAQQERRFLGLLERGEIDAGARGVRPRVLDPHVPRGPTLDRDDAPTIRFRDAQRRRDGLVAVTNADRELRL